MSHTQEQQHFIISEVAADWHELMVPHRIIRPSTTVPTMQLADIPPPQLATLGLHPIAHARYATTHFQSY